MVDFTLSQEQNDYKELAFDFGKKVIAPRAQSLDESKEFPLEIYRQAFESGLMNLHLDESLGGLALSLWDAAIICEELAAFCPAQALAISANNLSEAPLLIAGSQAQKEEFLKPLANSLGFAAFAHFEGPGRQTKASESGKNFVLSGKKHFVLNAFQAEWFYVTASSEAGRLALIVPKDAQGILLGERQETLGLKSLDFRTVEFQEVVVGQENMVGRIGQESEITHKALMRNYPIFAAMACGLGRKAMEHAISYAKERSTFGQPISQHQAVAFMLADMAKNLQAARFLAWQAAYLLDQGQGETKQAQIARAFATNTATGVCLDAVQIFGGYGYSNEYPVAKLSRDAKMLEIYAGTVHQDRVDIAQSLVGVS